MIPALPFTLVLALLSPDPCAATIDRLGAPLYADREAAARDLAFAVGIQTGPIVAGRLAVGITHRDPEVRMRVHAVLRRALPCTTCHGWPVQFHDSGRPWTCTRCGGSGVDRRRAGIEQVTCRP